MRSAPNKEVDRSRLARVTAWIEDGFVAVMLTAMVVIAAAQIVLRNLFDTGLSWGDPLLRMLVLWTAVVGAVVASRTENHISIDILSRFLPASAQVPVRVLTDLFTVAVCVILCYYSIQFVILDYEAETTTFADVPLWWLELIIPIGFGLIGLRYLEALIRLLRQGLKP